jgi:hypothetical protein
VLSEIDRRIHQYRVAARPQSGVKKVAAHPVS